MSGPDKTVNSYSKYGELHNGWTTMVRFLAGEEILSSDYHATENSRHGILFSDARGFN
jgi:hypothetical protein